MKKRVPIPMRITSAILSLMVLFSMTANLGIITVSAAEYKTDFYVHSIQQGDVVKRGATLINDKRFANEAEVYIDDELYGKTAESLEIDRTVVLNSKPIHINSRGVVWKLYFKSIKDYFSGEELKENLRNNETVDLTEAIVLKNTIVINDGKNHVINTNGYSMSVDAVQVSMFIVENGSTLTINGRSEEDQNTTISNAGTTNSDGGAIRVTGGSKLVVNDVTFDENKGYRGGAVAAIDSSVEMNNCTVQNCSSFNMGGGLYADEKSTVTLTNCTFDSNSASFDKGGGLYAGEKSTVTLTNCTFDSNSASDGGAIGNFGTLTVSGCTIKSNTVKGGGAGIWSKGNATLTDTTVEQNTNAINGGGVTNHKDMTIKGCTISGNSASSWAGGIFNESSGSLVIGGNTVIEGNTANDGAGILHRQGKLSVTDTSVLNNSAKTAGGGIWANSDTQVTLKNVTLNENNCGTNGGAVNSHGTLDLSNCTIESNSAGNCGGGVYMDSASSLTLESASIINCTAENAGGGIYLYAGDLILAGGKLRITDNLTKGNYDNISQREFNNIQITDRLSSGSDIGIKPPSGSEPRDVTVGYGEYNDVAPALYFHCDTGEYRVNHDKKDEVNLIEGLRSTSKSYKIKILIDVTNDADLWDYAYFYIYGRSNRGLGEQKQINASPDFHESIDEEGKAYAYEYDCGDDYFPTTINFVTQFGFAGWRDFEGDVTIWINDVLVCNAHPYHKAWQCERKDTWIDIGGDKYPYPETFDVDVPPGDIDESGVITVSGIDQYGLLWKANGDNTSIKSISFPEEDTFSMVGNSGFKWKLSSTHTTNHLSTYHLTFKSGSNVYPEITKAITVRFVFPLHVRVLVDGKEVFDKTAKEREKVEIRNIKSIPGYYINGYEKEGTGELVKVKNADYDLTLINESVILRAKLQPNNYKIAFDGNGTAGSDGRYEDIIGNMNTKTAYYDKPFKLQGNNFMRTGYVFVGWNTQRDGKGTMFKDKDTVLNLTAVRKAEVKLYAIWRPEDGATTASVFSYGTTMFYIGPVVLILAIAISCIYYKRKKREGVQTADS